MLTIKKINAALAAEGIDLVLKQSGDYHPFSFYGPGIELIHHSCVVVRDNPIKKVNAIPLETWLTVARHFARQIAAQRQRIKLPEWIKVGNSVIAVENGFVRETSIKRIYSDGSERVTIEYEHPNFDTSWLWGDGRHCAGPVIFRDREAYSDALKSQQRALQMIDAFTKLSAPQQIALLEQATSQR